jgi:sulfotransferase family protein
MTPRVPDFFVVGAQKAGTTSLHDRIVKHPKVCLPILKETQFFAFEEKFSLGFDWYRTQFPDCRQEQVMGEICPDYMYFEGTAERIHSCIKHPKLIFIFREPLKRAYSHYLMSIRQGFENLSFDEALKAEEERIAKNELSVIYHSYMSRGAYTEQVERFLAVFPSAECLFIRFEDLTDNGLVGEKTFSDICDFLGLSQMNIDIEVHSNAASQPRSIWLRDRLYGQGPMKRILGRMLPRHVKEKLAVTVDRWNQKKIEIKEMGDVSPRFIQQAILEKQKLQSLTGLDLKSWIDPE